MDVWLPPGGNLGNELSAMSGLTGRNTERRTLAFGMLRGFLVAPGPGSRCSRECKEHIKRPAPGLRQQPLPFRSSSPSSPRRLPCHPEGRNEVEEPRSGLTPKNSFAAQRKRAANLVEPRASLGDCGLYVYCDVRQYKRIRAWRGGFEEYQE